MKIPSATRHRSGSGDHAARRALRVEMTPMIDVVFLLLIFFLWTASFQIAEQLLPSQVAEPNPTRGATQRVDEEVDFEPVIIRITWQAGRPDWSVNGRTLNTLAEVAHTLVAVAKIKTDIPVIVDPDGSVPLGSVIDVYDLTRRSGFQQVQFAADW